MEAQRTEHGIPLPASVVKRRSRSGRGTVFPSRLDEVKRLAPCGHHKYPAPVFAF